MIASRVRLALALAGLFAAACPAPAAASELQQSVLVRDLADPVCFAVLPDGRVLIGEQGGTVRLVRGGALAPRPVLSVPTRAFEEDGLLALEPAPDFARSHRLYVAWTALTPARHTRIASFELAGDRVRPGSERRVLDLDADESHQHHAGAMHFGADGRLYLSTGDNGDGDRSHSLRSTMGKLLRIAADGAIPADGPFVTRSEGVHRAIWARGLRNPFAFDIQPETGRIFICDVGGERFEEVNDGIAGADYGWPGCEGPCAAPGVTAPVHAYDHANGCAITAGVFVASDALLMPAALRGAFVYAEYCRSELRVIDPAAPAHATTLAPLLVPGPVAMRREKGGGLLVLCRGGIAPTGGPATAKGALIRVQGRDPRH